ncbi:MAG TPA: hypothetical protein VI381_06120, partial [Allosphingosinicella sp.]
MRVILPAAALAAGLMAGSAMAEPGYGTVKFTVEVVGKHNVPTPEGGFRNVLKSRIFTGSARVKYGGQGFGGGAIKGYDREAYEQQKDACERDGLNEAAIAACQDEVQDRQNAAERRALQSVNPAAAMRASKVDVWATEDCTGTLQVADKGIYRGIEVA